VLTVPRGPRPALRRRGDNPAATPSRRPGLLAVAGDHTTQDRGGWEPPSPRRKPGSMPHRRDRPPEDRLEVGGRHPGEGGVHGMDRRGRGVLGRERILEHAPRPGPPPEDCGGWEPPSPRRKPGSMPHRRDRPPEDRLEVGDRHPGEGGVHGMDRRGRGVLGRERILEHAPRPGSTPGGSLRWETRHPGGSRGPCPDAASPPRRAAVRHAWPPAGKREIVSAVLLLLVAHLPSRRQGDDPRRGVFT
jgi:hypothetical protein